MGKLPLSFGHYDDPNMIKIMNSLNQYISDINKKTIFYPGSGSDISPIQSFSENSITFLDQEKLSLGAISNYINKEGLDSKDVILINQNIETFDQKFDILLEKRSQIYPESLDKNIKPGGYIMLENARAHGNYFYNSPNYELIINLSTGGKTYKEVTMNNPWSSGDTNYYLFKKLEEGENKKINNQTGSFISKIKEYLNKLFKQL